MTIPNKTLERLSLYKRLLQGLLAMGQEFIYSHDLAKLAQISSAQVRRDLMCIKHIGNPNKGYDIRYVVQEINSLLGTKKITKICLVGVGNLGRAILSYFTGKHADLPIVAAFDSDPDKQGRIIAGCPCYALVDAIRLIREQQIELAILALPSSEAPHVVDTLCEAGIKGIVNFTHATLKAPDSVFVENVDISIALEKAAYHVRRNRSK